MKWNEITQFAAAPPLTQGFFPPSFCTEAIQQYFGSKIAIYFAWLGYYTTALTVPAVIGLIFWVSGKIQFTLNTT